MKGRPCLAMICFCLVSFLLWSPAHGRSLKPGEQITLTPASTQSLTLDISKTGEYLLETLGESDTNCTLVEPTQGVIASDRDSGVARNCRIVKRLSVGKYKLVVHKNKRPASLRVKHLKPAGHASMLRLGSPKVEELTADRVRTFRFRLVRRQWLHLKAWGVTVRHCRVLRSNGWHVEVTRKITTRRATRHGRIRMCWLRGLLEPGSYKLQVVGQHSLPSPKSLSVKQGKLVVHVGARALRPFRWNRVKLKDVPHRSFWFTIPASWGHRRTGKVKLLLQASTNTLRVPFWSMKLHQQDWLNTKNILKTQCFRHRRHRFSRRCDSIVEVEAGKRFKLSLSGSLNQRLWLRYVVIFPQGNIPLQKRVRVLEQPGQWSNIGFTSPRSDTYWVEAWPQTDSCILQQEIRPNVWHTVAVRGMALPKQDKKPSSAQPWEDWRSKRWSQRLGLGGMQQWLKLNTESTVVLETFGKADTKCEIRTAFGRRVGYNDDRSKTNRSCRVEKRLQPGLYKLKVTPYGKVSSSYIRMQIRYRGDKRNTAVPITGGCSFAAHLKPGPHRILMGTNGRLTVKEVGVFSLPLRNLTRIRIPQIHRTPLDRKLARVTVPLQFKRGYRWIAISGAQKCRLHRNGRLVKIGRTTGRTCRIRGKLSAGTYALTFGQFLLRTQRLSLRIGSSAKMQRHSYRRMPTLGSKDKRTLFPLLHSNKKGRWLSTFALQTLQKATLVWRIPNSGLYRLQSQGLLKVRCAIQNMRAQIYQSARPTLQRRNCNWLGYLRAGTYHIHVQAQGLSSGRVQLSVRPVVSSEMALRRKQTTYARMLPDQGVAYTWKLPKAQKVQLQAHSIDGNIQCRLEDESGWPIFHAKSCKTVLSLKAGSYRLFLYPNQHTTRFRLRVVPYTPRASAFVLRNIKSKALTLPLQKTTRLRYKAPQPSDTMKVHVPAVMTVTASLSHRLLARVFRNNKFITTWFSGKKNTTQLQPGTYRIVLQSRRSSLRSRVVYRLGVFVTQSQPGFRWKQRVPSALSLRLEKASHIQLSTEGNNDTWCRIVDRSGQVVASNDNASNDRWDCRLRHWLPKGSYKLFVEGSKGRTWLSVKRYTPLQTQSKNRVVFEKRIEKEGVYQLTLQGPVTRCFLTNRSMYRKAISCDELQVLTQGKHQWHIHSSNAHKVKVGIRMLPAISGGTFRLRLKEAKSVAFPLEASKPGLYRISSQSSIPSAWYLHVKKHNGLWKRLPPHRSTHLVYLAKGTHQLSVQAPRNQSTLQGTLQVERIQAPPSNVLPKSHGIYEGSIKVFQPQRWKLKSPGTYQITATLQGNGNIYLWKNQHDLQQHCETQAGRAQTCRWYSSGSKLALWLSSPSSMRYRIRVRPLPMGRTVFTLQPGQQWQSQGQDTSKASGQFVFHLKAKSVATFEVVGGKASCTVWVQGRIRQGCRMKIKQDARLVVRYQQAPQRVLLYSAGQRETVLWGNPKQASWKSFVLKKPKIVRLALYGGKGIVCVIRNKAGSVLSARSHAKGCVIEQPLQPGEYEVGASSRAYPISKKRMRLSFTTALPVREGEKNSYLLGSGESRWFKFTLTGKRYVGLAAIGSHDDLQCELRSQANRRVLVGCQRHSHLRKGTYWYRVSLPEKAQATAVRIVLRGQTPPAQTAPASYLKNLLQPKR